MIFNATSRARVREAERLWVAKFVLRILCLLTSLLGIILAGVSIGYGGAFLALGLAWLMIPLGVSVIWNAANIIVRLARARPMHPGANVGMDLVLWLVLIPTLTFAFAAGILFLNNDYFYYCRDYSYSYSSYSTDYECADNLKRQGGVDIAGGVFGTISLILHFTLFVWACVDTHRRNNIGAEQRAATMAATMMSQMHQQNGQHQPMSPQGYYPPPQQGGVPYPPQAAHMPGQQPGQYGGAGSPPPGVGPAYAQHQSYYDTNSVKPYPMDQTRDVSGAPAHGHGGGHGSGQGLAPGGEGHGQGGQSPALSSASPVGRSDESQPEVAHNQSRAY